MAIKILLVDDHPLIIEGLAKVLSFAEEIKIVGKAYNGRQAVDLAKRSKPNVVIMDINMPVLNGVESCREIKNILPNTEIIALTVCEDKENILRALKAGVRGYFLKDVQPEILIEAVKKVHKKETYFHPEIAAKILNRDRSDSKNMTMRDDLTKREVVVLKLLAKGCSNKEIASKLTISEKTVKNHITNILRKLELRDRVQAAIWAIKEEMI